MNTYFNNCCPILEQRLKEISPMRNINGNGWCQIGQFTYLDILYNFVYDIQQHTGTFRNASLGKGSIYNNHANNWFRVENDKVIFE